MKLPCECVLKPGTVELERAQSSVEPPEPRRRPSRLIVLGQLENVGLYSQLHQDAYRLSGIMVKIYEEQIRRLEVKR